MKISPTKLAREILEKSKPHKSFINVESVALHYGIPVKKADLPEEISGMLQREGNKKAIYINAQHHPNRQRFTLAHELGHFFLNHTIGVHVDKTTLFRDEESSLAIKPIEIDANRFAAELLMPEDMIRTSFQQIVAVEKDEDKVVQKMAKKFKVSVAAMNYRLQNVGIKLAGF